MVMVVIVVVVIVMMLRLTVRTARGARDRPFDGSRTHEWVPRQNDAATDRLPGFGMLGQRRILDGLLNLVTPHRLSGARQGFINVGNHKVSRVDGLDDLKVTQADPRFQVQQPAQP